MRTLIALTGWLVASFSCVAADTTAGRWEGGVRIPEFLLNVVVDLNHEASGAWIGSIIIPELNIKGAQLSDIDVRDTDVSFAIKGVLADPQAGPASSRRQPS